MGETVLKRQVSTKWNRVPTFFDDLRVDVETDGGFMVIVEVCGFNDWLLKMFDEYECREIVLIQPAKRSKRKTDAMRANWANCCGSAV